MVVKRVVDFRGLYAATFVGIFLIVVASLLFSHQTSVLLSPDTSDGRDSATDEALKGNGGAQQGGLAGGGVINECDYMVEPQEGEEWFEPYPFYHMLGPGDYVIGNDLIMEDSTLHQYSTYIKGCLTLLESGDYNVDGQGHTITIDDITCTSICPGLYSSGAAFYLAGGKEINFEIDNIHVSNKLNSLVKAEPGYFDEFFNFFIYGLSGHTITVLNSEIESEKTFDMNYMNANAYIENSGITSIYLRHCSLEGACESTPVNPKSMIELKNVEINSFHAFNTPYVALSEVYAPGSEYGSYDLTIDSRTQDLDLQELIRADVSNEGFSETHLGHLALVCKDQCNSLIDMQDSNYYVPVSFSLEMNEGEVWFGKEPAGASAGSAGNELKHPSAVFLYFSNLQQRLAISHNFISIVGGEFGDGPIFDRPAVLILKNNPSGGATGLKIMRNGVECTSCVAFTALNAQTVIFSVPNAGNYSIAGQLPISYDITQSAQLSSGIVWSNALPATSNLPANGNNGAGATNYFLSVSAQGTNVDVYMKADGNLVYSSGGGISILIDNEKYAFSSNPNVPTSSAPLTLNYVKIGNNLGDGSIIYLKFFLDTPSGQQAGDYSNLVQFVAVPAGAQPPAG